MIDNNNNIIYNIIIILLEISTRTKIIDNR